MEIHEIRVEKRTKIKKPDMYKVIMLNDDYTTMEFVIEVLMSIFQKDAHNAQRIMLEIHEKGFGEAGVFTLDIARSKIEQVHKYARKQQFPLRCKTEKA